ncbi:MAG: hypothetical protein HYZ53_22770 [Planctomycetes bacterium]|nr:hypothetical protein [Planctomycetota bacterium]
MSNAQGRGKGRRGDGADGHSWAGGLGALLDCEGDDRYSAGKRPRKNNCAVSVLEAPGGAALWPRQ